ncbi:uncharacterized protein LOC121389487 [Gigantopelta aegis]|uniref:uncharacterized protein LOC121389487 n=1 Tax=Gigantopelta aegis TaxID=1735272 RepID=UPI001B888491|nr:uncharacterized protein LOC121389487 [Gigantopelta aegis]
MKLLIVVLVCMVALCSSAKLAAQSVNICPATDLTESFYADKVAYNSRTYRSNRKAEAELTKMLGAETIKKMESSARCVGPDEKPVSTSGTSCEPCPSRAYHLHKFNRNRCVVILPHIQLVRYVRCSYRSCYQFCPCGKKRCRNYGWSKTWFFAFCFQPYGSWHVGLNYYYLWLPQDCLCY